MRYTFKVYERLKREQHIDTLFQAGKAFSVFPLKAIYLVRQRSAGESPVMTGFSVPKKKFPSSVHRHRIRRLMVESWRLHKHELYNLLPTHVQLHMFFIFTDRKLPDYAMVELGIIKCIEKLRGITYPPSSEHEKTTPGPIIVSPS